MSLATRFSRLFKKCSWLCLLQPVEYDWGCQNFFVPGYTGNTYPFGFDPSAFYPSSFPGHVDAGTNGSHSISSAQVFDNICPTSYQVRMTSRSIETTFYLKWHENDLFLSPEDSLPVLYEACLLQNNATRWTFELSRWICYLTVASSSLLSRSTLSSAMYDFGACRPCIAGWMV